MLQLAPLVGHIAYAMILCSFLVRSIAQLRVISVVASVAAIGYSAFATAEVLDSIFWNVVFILINAWQLYVLRQESRQYALNDTEARLQQGALRNFSSFEIKTLVGLADSLRPEPGARLIRKGETPDCLLFLLEGNLAIEAGGARVASLQPGSFAGEMSFLTGDPARADVLAGDGCRLVAWNRDKLAFWLDGEGSRRSRLQSALGTQIVGLLTGRTSSGPGSSP